MEGASTYSPFPAGIDLNRVWRRPVLGYRRIVDGELVSYGLRDGQQITVIYREPVAHIRRDFTMTIDLDDFVVSSY